MKQDIKIETFDQYQNFTDETAIYPEGHDGLDYLFLGAIGEAGEICNKLKKIIRGDHKMTVPAKEELGDECGDTMWYIVQLARQYGFPLSRIMNNNVRDYQMKTKSDKGLVYKYSIRLSFILTQFASIHAFGRLTPDLKVDCLRGSIFTLVAIIKALDLDLPGILSNNVIKLKKRKSTNTIKGSGDKRQDEMVDNRKIVEPSVNKIANLSDLTDEERERQKSIKERRIEALKKAREAKKKKAKVANT